ncbi:unnamed protein product [Strongylus vulgaris]|uniref:Uncharacterized protein n=1 Tax=Strongylus vulgaris TaxID=40348 RepID=A0A3P7JMN7_STRVU|nr:unnamed protein product [Strongylus vulgaris]
MNRAIAEGMYPETNLAMDQGEVNPVEYMDSGLIRFHGIVPRSAESAEANQRAKRWSFWGYPWGWARPWAYGYPYGYPFGWGGFYGYAPWFKAKN